MATNKVIEKSAGRLVVKVDSTVETVVPVILALCGGLAFAFGSKSKDLVVIAIGLGVAIAAAFLIRVGSLETMTLDRTTGRGRLRETRGKRLHRTDFALPELAAFRYRLNGWRILGDRHAAELVWNTDRPPGPAFDFRSEAEARRFLALANDWLQAARG
jgi:hypothetical protein